MLLKRKKVMQQERITKVVWWDESEHKCLVTLEDRKTYYENHYLWKYILRDTILTLLSGYDVYLCVEGTENLDSIKEDFGMYECVNDKEGIRINCHRINAYILTILMEEYESLWEYAGPVHFFAALENEKESNLQNSGYQIRISSLKDNMGIEIEMTTGTLKEKLLRKIEFLMNSYQLKLVVKMKE